MQSRTTEGRDSSSEEKAAFVSRFKKGQKKRGSNGERGGKAEECHSRTGKDGRYLPRAEYSEGVGIPFRIGEGGKGWGDRRDFGKKRGQVLLGIGGLRGHKKK